MGEWENPMHGVTQRTPWGDSENSMLSVLQLVKVIRRTAWGNSENNMG